MSGQVPTNYSLFNDQSTKQPIVVVKIDGVEYLLSSAPVYTRVRYGDPGIFYGDPGLVYGGLRKKEGVKDLLSLEGSSLNITQTVEPERGKGTVSQMVLTFVDIDQYMTQLISPGVIVDEIMGRDVSVFLGYAEISYPEDYFQIFRGFVSSVKAQSGRVILQLSDPNLRKRQRLFFQAKSKLTANLSPSDTTVPVVNAADYHQQIMGPDGGYTTAIKTYIKINDEFIQYGPTGISGNSFVSVTRGTRGTVPAAHALDDDVEAWVEISDHAVTMALQTMLSGWNGYWKTDVPILSIKQTTFASVGAFGVLDGAITLPVGVDAKRDYGLIEGDYVTITGSGVPANNVTLKTITRFITVGDQTNRIIVIDDPLVVETPSAALLSFRSKYDVYPNTCGLKLTPQDVDVERHEYYKSTFLVGDFYNMRFILSDPQDGKSWLEQNVYLGIGGYAITQRGRVSMGLTKPPLADQKLIVLDKDSVLNPESIAPERTISGRFFYNEITFNYDYDDDGKSRSVLTRLDSDSLSKIKQSTVLPINSKGIRSDITPVQNIQRRAQLLLSRFKNAAVTITVKTKYQEANQIEIGDVVAIKDNGGLQISNFSTGSRDLGFQLYEVQQRSLDIKTGSATMMLVAGVGAEATDRYATFGPSSQTDVGSTTAAIKIKDSYGAVFPGDEPRKWENYIGQVITIHSDDWTFSETVTFRGFDPLDRYKLLISPPLSVAPPANYVVDQPAFPSSADPTVQQVWKVLHCSWTPRVQVVSGASNFIFDVGPSDAGKFFVGSQVIVHSYDFTVLSPETTVTSVSGTTITVKADLGLTPSAGQFVDLIGFPDKSGAYRWI